MSGDFVVLDLGRGLLGEIDEVVVVGEDEDLGFLAEFFEDGEEGAGAVVVEGDQEVVEDQRDGRVFIEMEIDGGEAEGEVELVGSAF